MRESLLRIFALLRRELIAVLKDPRSRVNVLALPILQCLIFGYAASYDLNHVPYAAFDEDHSLASREFLARFDGSPAFERVANLNNARDIDTAIDDGRALVVIRIAPDFARDLLLGKPAIVQAIADGRNSNTAGAVLGYVGAITDGFNAGWTASHGQTGLPIRIVSRAWFNPNLETRWSVIPGLIGTITLIQTMMLAAMSVAREREHGTFDQLLVMPFRPMEITVGKALPAVIVGLMQATCILLVAQLWFCVPFVGSFATLYAGLTLFLLAAVGIGIFVSAIAATMQQAMLYGFLLITSFTLLSGLSTPIGDMPGWLQTLTYVNPLRYAIIIAQRVYLEGTGIVTLLPDLWPMFVIAAVTLGAATWTFRRRVA